jgi:Trypsin-like peptidase domain
MPFATPFCLGLIAAAILAEPAHPQDANYLLRFYAVRIGAGYGVNLGKGIVITAAHVAGLEPRVEIAGRDLPTKVVKRGDDVDLTLLSIDEHLPARLGLRHMPLCQKPPATGEPVFVAIPEGVARSYVMSPSQLPPDIPAKFRTAIRFVDPGTSGSGVFDANEKCLLGIISSLTRGSLLNPNKGGCEWQHGHRCLID